MNLPTLSVVTPSFNSGAFVEDAILSVARQESVSAEHMVIDGGSKDGTVSILQQHPDLLWTSEPDRGQSDAINKGFRRAGGDLVGWLNADDYYLPGGLEAIARAAQENPEADVIYGDCVFVDERGQIVRSKVEHDFDRSVLLNFGCYIPSTSTFFRRRIIDAGELLNCDFRVCMDFEYFARLANLRYQFHYVPRFIAAFRWHGSNISIRNMTRRAEERALVQRRYGSQTLEHSALLGRARRLWRKAWSGNLDREFRIRQMMGRSTCWLHFTDGQQTCQRLACL